MIFTQNPAKFLQLLEHDLLAFLHEGDEIPFQIREKQVSLLVILRAQQSAEKIV